MGKKNDVVIDFLSNDEVFAALFNGYLFAGKQVIQPKNLKEIDRKAQFFLAGSNLNNKNTYEIIKRERDVVREVMIGDIPVRLAILGVEHQSEVDYSMAIRVLTYDTLEYLKQAKRIQQHHTREKDVIGKEYLSKFTKEDRLIPTVTLVFYTGKEEWDAALELKELFSQSDFFDSMQSFIGNWRLNLISVYNVEETERYQGSLKKVFDILRYVNDGKAMLSFVNEHRNDYLELDEATRRLLVLLTDMDFYSEKEDMEEVPNVCKALEDIKNMGIEEGIEEGIVQGEESIIRKMSEKGMTCEQIAEMTDIALERVREILSK